MLSLDELRRTVVGFTNVVLDGERSSVRTKETNLGNLITDAMLEKAKTIVPGTTIAFQNGGGIRSSINLRRHHAWRSSDRSAICQPAGHT
jgi:2',3'-cyclic-nucleotide 2'-phosphodiesterase/3'-nucleotidase/5'-nucleotidase